MLHADWFRCYRDQEPQRQQHQAHQQPANPWPIGYQVLQLLVFVSCVID
jgi:hypothetical protein